MRSCRVDSRPYGIAIAQHRRMLLDVEAVLQAQRPELVLGQLAGEEAPRLVAELGDALVDDALVESGRSDTWSAVFGPDSCHLTKCSQIIRRNQ